MFDLSTTQLIVVLGAGAYLVWTFFLSGDKKPAASTAKDAGNGLLNAFNNLGSFLKTKVPAAKFVRNDEPDASEIVQAWEDLYDEVDKANLPDAAAQLDAMWALLNPRKHKTVVLNPAPKKEE
jgi:hypothetical protein